MELRPRLWFDAIYLLAGALALGSVSTAVLYASGGDGVGYIIPPTVEAVSSPPDLGVALQREPIPASGEEVKGDAGMKMDPTFTYNRDWSSEDVYLLAKIAMAEAEGSTIQCMTLVIMSVLNRVESDRFPDSVREVIFQYDEGTGIYQFSCIGNGRWDKVEPDQDCYEAVSVVQNAEHDYSGGALYFESCSEEDNWHSRNLDYLYQCGELRFYR